MNQRNAQQLQNCVQRDFWFQTALDRLRAPRGQTNQEPAEEPTAPTRQSPAAPPLPLKNLKPIPILVDD